LAEPQVAQVQVAKSFQGDNLAFRKPLLAGDRARCWPPDKPARPLNPS
jgi:hypothetical protein